MVSVFWLWGVQDLSSLTRDWTYTLCIGRRSLNDWAVREVPRCWLLSWTPKFNQEIELYCMQNPLLFPYRMWDMETIYFYLKPGMMNVTVTPMQCQWAVNVLFPHLVTAGSPSSLPSAFKRAANSSEETLLVSGISPGHQPTSVCCVPTQQTIHTRLPLLSALSSKSGYHHQFSLPFLSPQIQCLLLAVALLIFSAHLPCPSKGWCLQRTQGPFFMTVLSQNLNDHLYADRS